MSVSVYVSGQSPHTCLLIGTSVKTNVHKMITRGSKQCAIALLFHGQETESHLLTVSIKSDLVMSCMLVGTCMRTIWLIGTSRRPQTSMIAPCDTYKNPLTSHRRLPSECADCQAGQHTAAEGAFSLSSHSLSPSPAHVSKYLCQSRCMHCAIVCEILTSD